MSVYPYIVAGWVMACGLFGIARSRNLVHLILCLSVVQSGTYVLLLAIGYRQSSRASRPTGRPSTRSCSR